MFFFFFFFFEVTRFLHGWPATPVGRNVRTVYIRDFETQTIPVPTDSSIMIVSSAVPRSAIIAPGRRPCDAQTYGMWSQCDVVRKYESRTFFFFFFLLSCSICPIRNYSCTHIRIIICVWSCVRCNRLISKRTPATMKYASFGRKVLATASNLISNNSFNNDRSNNILKEKKARSRVTPLWTRYVLRGRQKFKKQTVHPKTYLPFSRYRFQPGCIIFIVL